MDIDISQIQEGQRLVILWAARPVFIVRRPKEALDELKAPNLLGQLRDPNSEVWQQPPYARNWSRSIRPDFLVVVGICTHLGCVPLFDPKPDPTSPAPDWLGGFFCPCHGSKYDLAGRVFQGVPAPYNLPVPPYSFPEREDPAGRRKSAGADLRLQFDPAGVTALSLGVGGEGVESRMTAPDETRYAVHRRCAL